MSGHQQPYEGKSNEWLTPPEIIEALGPFDLDPCAPIERPWPTANRHYTVEDDGLRQPWDGFVWVNPPYGPHTWKWLHKLAEHGRGRAVPEEAQAEPSPLQRLRPGVEVGTVR